MRGLILTTLLAASVSSLLPEHFLGRKLGGLVHKRRELLVNRLDNDDIGRSTIDQILDHFDTTNTNTFKQHYFYNTAYTKPDSNVNFLYISGEQTAEDYDVTADQPLTDYAALQNATIYSLEHRYYGVSRPFNDTALETLKYFSSRQAVEDIAEFIRQKNQESTRPQKWIVVGGSYAGNLAAWSRLKHPELIVGAISSSAPLLAQMNFYGYLQIVEKDIKAEGEACYNTVSDAIREARELFNSKEGRDKLGSIFDIFPTIDSYDVITENDIATFFRFLIDGFMGAAQYGDPSTIADLCKTITSVPDRDPVESLSTIVGVVDMNFTALVEVLREEWYGPTADTRLWVYQTCNEFGFFESTNRGANIFHDTQSTSSFISLCSELFNVDANQIQANVDATNDYYGQRDYYAGTNVIFTHGTQDPWAYLTKQKDPQHWSVVIAEVEGGTHCSDIDPDVPSIPSRKQIQALTKELIDQWLNGPFDVPDRVDLSDNVAKRPQFFSQYVSVPDEASWSSVPTAAKAQYTREASTTSNINLADARMSGRSLANGKLNKIPPSLLPDVNNTDIEQSWISQPWDHFNMNDERRFNEKFYVNTKFGTVDGPNFLLIGGELPSSTNWLANEELAWMTYAKDVGANAYVLEHRYYGKSTLNTTDLQYLTSAQMLYDVAQFIKTMKKDRKVTGPWITFGGSYAGALAAWSREWFPELILGAVGSSAPVWVKTDFYEYLQVVEKVLTESSQSCADRVADAFEMVRVLTLDVDGRATLSNKFNIVPAWNTTDAVPQINIQNVMMNLFGLFQGVAQYDSPDLPMVAAVCSIMTSPAYPDSMDALRTVQETLDTPGCETSSDPNVDIEILKDMINYVDGHDNLVYSDVDMISILWTWQTCNEFGYYQSTDYGSGIFGTTVPLKSKIIFRFFINVCEKVFDIGMDQVEFAVAHSQYQYGGKSRFAATNVVLPNGNHDPWHALGILEQGDLDPSVVPIIIEGTTHMYDMFAAKDTDSAQLTQARKDILANIKKWLAPEAPTTTEDPATTQSTTVPTTSLSTTTLPDTTTTKSAAEVFSFFVLSALLTWFF